MAESTVPAGSGLTTSADLLSNDPAEEIEKLRLANSELRSKLERWRDQSKIGIEQHRSRIKELSTKLSASLQQISHLEKFISQVLMYFRGSSSAMFTSLTNHEKTVEMIELSLVKSNWSNLVHAKETLLQECQRTHQQKMEEKAREVDTLKDQLHTAEMELLELNEKVGQLEMDVKKLSRQEALRESTATHEAVSLAVRAAQENFDAEILSVRLQYENEKNELRILHEFEMNRVQEEMDHQIQAAKMEAEMQNRHNNHGSTGETNDIFTTNEDDSYIALFNEHEALQKHFRELQRENKQLREENTRQREIAQRKSSSSGTSHVMTDPSSGDSGLPASLSEAHSLLIALRGKEKTLKGELCDLQLQLGALREHPPLPDGALSAEQVKYVKTLFAKLFTASDRGRMVESLAPIIKKVLDFSASDPLHIPK